jgi:hypothetical protein
MAVTIIFRVPEAGREQYDAVMKGLGNETPGRIYHVAGPAQDGWMVVDVWESTELFEQFLAEKLIPVARKVGFFASLPESFEVYNIVEGTKVGATGPEPDAGTG